MLVMCKSAEWRALLPACSKTGTLAEASAGLAARMGELLGDHAKLPMCDVSGIVADITRLAPMDQPYWYATRAATDPWACMN